jgi:hypothetical protein
MAEQRRVKIVHKTGRGRDGRMEDVLREHPLALRALKALRFVQ